MRVQDRLDAITAMLIQSGESSLVHPQPVGLAPAAFRRWLGLGILLSGTFVASLDSFIVFVAVPYRRSGTR